MSPGFDDRAGFGKSQEGMFVETLIAQSAVEAYMDPARAQGCKSMNGRIRLQSYIRP
jgi:hypothetical protein